MSSSTWNRLIHRWEVLRPDLPRGGLNEPATERQLEIVESLIGMRLPEDLREAYLHINGSVRTSHKSPVPNVIPGVEQGNWMSLHEMVVSWGEDRVSEAGWDHDLVLGDIEEVPDEPCRMLYFHPGWLPVFQTYRRVYVDLAPSRWGQVGQVMRAGTGCQPCVLAPCFTTIVDRFLDEIDKGLVQWNGQTFVNQKGEEL